ARALEFAPNGDSDAVAQAEHLLGYVEHADGNLDLARDHFNRSIEAVGRLPGHWGYGHALSGLAWVALATGDIGEAERLLDEAISRLRHAGPWFSSLALYVRAVLAVRRGQ